MNSWRQIRIGLIGLVSLVSLALFLTTAPQQTLGQAQLSTDVQGVLRGETIWTKADSPYVLVGNVTVAVNSVLTIEPGVVVKGSAGTELKIFGKLEAIGTITDTITFTSVDDSAPDQWAGLVFDGGIGTLRYVTVRYGGNLNTTELRGNIIARNSNSLVIDHSEIVRAEYRGTVSLDVADYGLYLEETVATVSNTIFRENGNSDIDLPVYVTGDKSFLKMESNSFVNNQVNRVVIASKQWKTTDTTLTFRAQTGLDGYQFNEFFTIPEELTMAVEPGTTLFGGSTGGFNILGKFIAEGTATHPITLTNAKPSQEWLGLVFDGSSNNGAGSLKYVTVERGGALNNIARGNIIVSNVKKPAQVSIAQSTIAYAKGGGALPKGNPDHGLYIDNSTVIIDSTSFNNNGGYDNDDSIYVTGDDAELLLTRSSVVNNADNSSAPKGLLIYGGAVDVWCSSFSIKDGQGIYQIKEATDPLTVTVELSSFADNVWAIQNNRGPALDVRYNWWGDASGPTIQNDPEAGGSGQGISGKALYEPWLTAPSDCQLRVYLPMVQK